MNTKKSGILLISACAVILSIVLVLNIAVGIFNNAILQYVIGYKKGEIDEATRAEGEALAAQIQQEGTVLVKNENGALPLDKQQTPKLSVFGWDSTEWVYGGSGSGQVVGERVDLLKALDDYGIEYFGDLADMYTRFQARREYHIPGDSGQGSNNALHSFSYEFCRLYEPSIRDSEFYSEALLNGAKEFSDTALVILGRITGESNDAPKKQYKKNSASHTIVTDEERTYLEISTEEEELLRYVGENYQKVIVIVNSTNVMELGFLDTIEGLDACMIVGTTGTSAASEIPKLLYGESSPSGKTADTYAYDLTTSPTYVNVGAGIKGPNGGEDTTNFYTNGNGLYPTTVQHTNGSARVSYSGVAYTDYAESIYLGYKWYETADAVGFWQSEKAKTQWGVERYDDVVQFPFGFGLSYTSFSWKVTRVYTPNGASVTEQDELRFQIEITNTGEQPGQDTVELYYSAPYSQNGIEKSAVNLAAFAKTTRVLQPGESETVEVAFEVGDMKSYDYNDANKNGFCGYELEKGEYLVTLRTDAHTLAGSKLEEGEDTYTYIIDTDIKLQKDSESGNAVKNLFTGEDAVDGVAIDGNSDQSAQITYLSRGAIETTFPFVRAADRAMTDEIKALNLYTEEMANSWTDSTEDIFTNEATGSVVFENGEITDLGLMLGDPDNYDDDLLWEPVLNSLDWEEMKRLVLHGFTKTQKLTAIGKPQTRDLDGPNQVGSFNASLEGKTGFSSIVLAQTWNLELAYNLGLTIAKEAAASGINGWYGPGLNPHRSPFGGRNWEYYSEDPYLSGMMCAYAVAAARNGGVYSYLKHMCLYESESGRDGMYNWLTEQSLREIYLKPFELAVKTQKIKNGEGKTIRTVGGCTGVMSSYGRIGAVWTGGSHALLTDLLRTEWGFKGAVLTDYSDNHIYMNGDQMVRAGGDLWMDDYGDSGKFRFETISPTFRNAVRRANKNVIYMWLNALAVNYDYNADGDNVQIITKPAEPNFPWHYVVLAIVDVAAVIGVGCIVYVLLKRKRKEH